jgi:hypothetical protein
VCLNMGLWCNLDIALKVDGMKIGRLGHLYLVKEDYELGEDLGLKSILCECVKSES